MLMSRPKVKPRIIVKTDGKEVVVEQGGIIAAPVEDVAKPAKKTGKTGLAGVGQVTLPTVTHKAGIEGVGGGVLATAVGGTMVLASVFPSGGKKQVMAAAKSGKGVLQVTAPPQHYKGSSVQQKPSRRRKPTQKLAERLKQQEASKAADVTASGPSLQDSDFDSSEEDTLLPFLDSSLSMSEKERRASQDSTSSWQSSNSDTNDRSINIDLSSVTHTTAGSIATPPVPTPTFLSTINMEAEDVLGGAGLGEAESDGAGVGGATQWLSPPSSTGSSSNNSAD